jgi:hypothetical protein
MDRNHYRMCEDSSLLEQAKYNPTAELATVLAERLVEMQAEFDEKIEEYTDRIADLEREFRHLTEDTYIAEGA